MKVANVSTAATPWPGGAGWRGAPLWANDGRVATKGPKVDPAGVRRREKVRHTDDWAASTLARDCRDMAEVRAEIDRVDRLLVALVAERQAYIEAAARLKDREEDVRLEWRIEDVVAKVLAAADAAGLSKRIAEPVWRELIDRCIAHEAEIWRSLRTRNDI